MILMDKIWWGHALRIVVGITVLVLLLAGGAGAVTQIDSCTTISVPGEYVLNHSIINSSAIDCIHITSSDVIFDGAGYTIDGVNVYDSFGVYVYNSTMIRQTNVTVKNLKLTDWWGGIVFIGSYGNITDNSVNSNNEGIVVWYDSNNNMVVGNTVNSNIKGIYLNSNRNNMLSNNNVSGNNYGFYLFYTESSVLNGNYAGNNYDGIYLNYSNNNNLSGNNASNNIRGISVAYSNSNNLSGNSASNNNNYGIELYYSDLNTLSKNIVSGNIYGISLMQSSNNSLSNNTALNNGYGIDLGYSSNNILIDNNISKNYAIGIVLSYSNDSNLSSNNVSNNEFGIRMAYSNNSTIRSNNASSNNKFGIYLSSSSNNTIYNNYFNNIYNAFDDGNNYWNTAKQPGINIIGGPYLGGNFWSDYTGWDTDGDGLGNTLIPYDSAGYMVQGGDYLPLTLPANASEIRGLKWDDRNGNGIRDAGEPGVANISICYSVNKPNTTMPATCTLTDESGSYKFMDLTPGDYMVNEILPSGKVQTFPSKIGTNFSIPFGFYFITLNASEIREGIDFGNANASEIHGMKFNDSNGNGIREVSESGVSGVGIRLTRMIAPGNERFAGFTYTDVNGSYSFIRLTPGFYRVEEIPTGRAQTYPANGSPYFINLSTGAVVGGVDFGNQPVPPGEIRGMKFNDSDGNGAQDAGEQGLPGVQICLSPSWRCTITDASGYYSFLDVPAGIQTVYETMPSGHTATTPAAVTVAVNSSQVVIVNFGNRLLTPPPQDVSVVQQYSSQNGVPTVIRPGLTNLTVRKNLMNLSGNVVSVNLTLKWGDGTIKTADMTQIGTTRVWEANISSPFPAGAAQMTFEIDIAPAGPGPEDAVQKGDVLFIDPSGQIRDACTGTPINGSTVTLLVESPPTTGNFDASPPDNQIPPDNPLTTGEDGKYSWMTVPGTYKVRAEKSGYISAESPAVIVQSSPISGLDINLYPIGGCPAGTINGTKFNDLNGNGIRDAGEPGLADWTITLTRPDGTIAQMNTDSNGNYTFNNLLKGTYILSEVMQSDWMQTAPSGGTYTVAILAGEHLKDKDFGNFKTGRIFGMKFNDLNDNGIKDSGEPGLDGWTIKLTRPDGTTLSTVTHTNGTFVGIYHFADLTEAGNYTIEEVLQPGWKQTMPAVGNFTVTITSGAEVSGADFGNIRLGEIHGMKFNDLNGNGIKEAGEPGLANWTIELTFEPNGSMLVTTTTDGNGNYSFTNLEPVNTAGNYIVKEINQDGWTQTAPASEFYAVNLSPGQIVTDKDFGNFKPGEIHGMKFEDLNANGIKDPSETGLAGWNITINGTDTITGKEVNITTTTDANGNYSFMNISNGTYILSEELQNGWIQTAPAAGNYTVTIDSRAVIKGQDFGNFLKGKITGGGDIPAANGQKATFGLMGQYPKDKSTAQGDVEYQDKAANLNIKSIQIDTVAVSLDKTKGAIKGLAQVNGSGSYPFVVYVEDNGEPGKGVDVFRISLPTYPYTNGAVLGSGNIQIHK